jgi:endothelin-converting enzyme/putative endopeptidase
MVLRRTSAILVALISSTGAFGAPDVSCQSENAAPSLVTGEFGPQGLATQTRSKSVKPGDDFFSYVNEGWVNSTSIPEGYWDYGQTSVLGAKVDQQINSLLKESLAKPSPKGSAAQQVGDAYASFLDTARIERRGLAGARSELRQILAAKTGEEVARWMADPTSSSIVAINLFPAEGRWRVHLDQQNISQPMLGLSGPDAYLRTDGSSASERAAYRAFIKTLFELAGVDHASARAARVVALETDIARNMWPFEKLRDRKANYHLMTVKQLIAYAPGFPWRSFLAARGVGSESDVVLGTDTAVQRTSKLFATRPVEDWKSYLAFHWLQNQIDVQPEQLRQASWTFYGKKLSGQRAPPSREEVASRLVNSGLGLQLGRLYAERYVSLETKASAIEMIDYLRKAFAERLAQATWMDEPTRAEALTKLARFKFKVGYPTIWPDFSKLDVRRNDAAGNLQRIRKAGWAYQLRRLNPQVKDEPWYETPQTVDASYSVLYNAIELPGAYLQPPYFDAKADPAVNFGAIGAFIGHEMGHGFDDQGIIYDGQGRMRDWWSSSALAQFHTRAKALVAQYDAYAPFPDAHVNGSRTIGENIADLSGLSLAYRAYHLYLDNHPCVGRNSLDGLTGDQRFFEAWAQAWRYKAPESAIRFVVANGFHAPTQYRVNGVVRNIDAWYQAFNVLPGDKMYLPPEQRVHVW